jgi:hypothetical protein
MSIFLPDDVAMPPIADDNLYFLNGIGHVWSFELTDNNSVVFEIGGYEFNTLQKRLWTIDPRIDLSQFWNPKQFLGLTIWLTEEAWTPPELSFRNGLKRFPVEWRTRIRVAGPNYVPDPTLNNSIYCRPGNTNQAWNELLITVRSAGEYFLNLENNLAYKYPVDYDYWGGTWYQLVTNYDN